MSGTDAAARPSLRLAVVVSALFGLLFAYDLFEAISNLIGVAQLNSFAAEAGLDPVVPWALPIVVVVLPPLVFVAALLLARGRRVGLRALILLGGLAVVATATLSLTALA